jgi:hypothetical protein
MTTTMKLVFFLANIFLGLVTLVTLLLMDKDTLVVRPVLIGKDSGKAFLVFLRNIFNPKNKTKKCIEKLP